MSYDDEFEAIVRNIADAIIKFRTGWDDFESLVLSVIPNLPKPVEIVAKKAGDKLGDKVDKEFDKFVKAYSERGSASAINEAASEWVEVGGLASKNLRQLQRDQLPSHGHWSGTAADKYGTVTIAQPGSINGLVTMANDMRTKLDEIVLAMRVYWAAMLVAIGGLIAAIAVAVVTVETVVGTIVSVLAGVVGFAFLVNQATTLFTDSMNSKKNDLNGKVEDHTHFSGDTWPPTTAADHETFVDASVRDGDESEWAPV